LHPLESAAFARRTPEADIVAMLKIRYGKPMRKTASPIARDELLNGFARALFKNDMDALYRVVSPDFLWSFHDGLGRQQAGLEQQAHLRSPDMRERGEEVNDVNYLVVDATGWHFARPANDERRA
jgi:hypothetical protein